LAEAEGLLALQNRCIKIEQQRRGVLIQGLVQEIKVPGGCEELLEYFYWKNKTITQTKLRK